MRMISENSLLTIVRLSRSHNTGTVARPGKVGASGTVDLVDMENAVDRPEIVEAP